MRSPTGQTLGRASSSLKSLLVTSIVPSLEHFMLSASSTSMKSSSSAPSNTLFMVCTADDTCNAHVVSGLAGLKIYHGLP